QRNYVETDSRSSGIFRGADSRFKEWYHHQVVWQCGELMTKWASQWVEYEKSPPLSLFLERRCPVFSTRHRRWLSVMLLLAAITFGTIGSAAAPNPSGVSRSSVTNNNNHDDDDHGPQRRLIRKAALVITMDPSLGTGPLGLIEHGDVLFEGDHIVAV